MIECDALIVGGGPAGSTCARALRQAGWNVLVIDRARFPRDKVCGGWLTPEVFQLLDLDPAGYRNTGLTLQEITGFRTGVLRKRSVDTQYPCVVSYAIRRCEFDEFLLRRAGVLVLEQTALTSLRRDGGVWVTNEEIRAPIVIGAGGHFCPVARRVRDRGAAARPVVAKEVEFPLNGHGTTVAPNTPELFGGAPIMCGCSRPIEALVRSVQTPMGRALLRSPLLTRHIILDRWFLRRQGATAR